MTKLFRHIRKTLFKEGKTANYLKYSIGEIVLVVIGILVALRLNIWNDTRNQNLAFENLIEALEKELRYNIEESNYELYWGATYMEQYFNLMNDLVPKENYKLNKDYFSLISTNKLDVIYDDIEVMINKQDQFPAQYKILIPQLKKFNNLFIRYKASEKDLDDITLEYVKYLVLHEPWYGDKALDTIDSKAFLQRLEFQLTNPIYKNFLKEHKTRYIESLRNMSGIRTTCIVLIAQIKKIRNHYSQLELQQEMTKNGLQPFESYDCEINTIQSLQRLNLETLYPFFNTSASTVFITWTDDTKHRIELQPGEITANSFTDRIKGNQLITLEVKDCRMKFSTAVNGYLLIEDKDLR
ncbi:MAG: hypothetical protein MUO53_09585 [Maribacter sp.]|nr:hypothetical protein [Maribacter sp.]